MRRLPQTLVLLSLLAACGGDEPGRDAPVGTVQRDPRLNWPPKSNPGVTHEFGVIPHGESRTAELEIPLPPSEAGWSPLRFGGTCSCARHQMVIRSEAGDVLANGQPHFVVAPGEKLILRLTVVTIEREARDEAVTPSRGQIVVQHPETYERVTIPVSFSFGVDAPLTWRPYAHLDIGRLAAARAWEQTFEIDHEGQDVEFGEPLGVEPDPEATTPGQVRPAADLVGRLEAADDRGVTLVHIKFDPADDAALGPFVRQLRIPTNLDGYELRLPVTGELIGNVEVSPPGTFSFGATDLREPYELQLVVTDHDPDRDPEFVVVGIVDNQGQSLAEHFDFQLAEIPGRARSRHAILRYKGTFEEPKFRGKVLLAKTADEAPLLELEFVGFHRPRAR